MSIVWVFPFGLIFKDLTSQVLTLWNRYSPSPARDVVESNQVLVYEVGWPQEGIGVVVKGLRVLIF